MRILVACLLLAMLAPAAAEADGDPASDLLLAENVFYPYRPPVSASLQRTLNAEAAAANSSHFPIKVALIAGPVDLGVISSLFGQPQKYAWYLDQEISFHGKQPLLVVMPSGYGVQGLSGPATLAARSLSRPAGGQSDQLARAAIVAVRKLAAAAGRPLKPGGSGAPAAGGATALIVVVLACACVGAAAVVITVRRRRAQAA
jgi:hypothetical protein